MQIRPRLRSLGIAAALGLVALAASAGPDPQGTGGRHAKIRDLNWSDLIPADWDEQESREALKLPNLRQLDDNDPRAQAALARLRAAWNAAPTEPALDGVHARLPGFVAVLEGSPDEFTEFLLVPYFGACIHTPPPPANQIVHVFPRTAVASRMASLPVSVSGTIRVVKGETARGTSGYAMHDAVVEKYVPPEKDRKSRILRFGARDPQSDAEARRRSADRRHAAESMTAG